MDGLVSERQGDCPRKRRLAAMAVRGRREVSGNPGHCVLGNTTQNSAAVLSPAPGPTDIVFANGAEFFEQPASGPAP